MSELLIVGILIVLNGVFSLSEFAIVSARIPRLEAMCETGRSGATAALALAREPSRFLSTVQIGITVISLLTGAYTGASVGGLVANALEHVGLRATLAQPLGFGIILATITYLSVVVGELFPKRLALRSPESVACFIAPPFTILARIFSPIVSLLDVSTMLLTKIFHVDTESRDAVSDHEIHSVVAEAEDAGVIEPAERQMITGVMRLGDRPVRGVMTPRADVIWLDVNAEPEETRRILTSTIHSYMPVANGSTAAMLGVVRVCELLSALVTGTAIALKDFARDVPAIPDTSDALDALSLLRKAELPVALVYDEHGHFEGMVTPSDMLEAIAGVFRSDVGPSETSATKRDDGSWELPGRLSIDELAEHLALTIPTEHDYTTAAGFVLASVREVPNLGQHVELQSWDFEIAELDGKRIEKLIATEIKTN